MRWNRLKGVTWSRPQSNSQRHQAIDMHPRDERRVDKANNGSLRQCCCAGACTENTTSTKPLLTTCSIRSSTQSTLVPGPPWGYTQSGLPPLLITERGRVMISDTYSLLQHPLQSNFHFSTCWEHTDCYLQNFAVLFDVGVKHIVLRKAAALNVVSR